SEHLGIFEIIPGGLHDLPKQGAALRDGNGMLDLPEKFPPLLAVHVFYDNNEVVCIKAVDLALKFDFRNGPGGKTGGVTAGERQGDKRRLDMRVKMNAATAGGKRIAELFDLAHTMASIRFSASTIRSSPEISFGSRVSRSCARVLDSCLF